MAIDTRTKRAAVPGVGRCWMRGKNPNASKDEEWRINTGQGYGGNALSAAAASTIAVFSYYYRKMRGG